MRMRLATHERYFDGSQLWRFAPAITDAEDRRRVLRVIRGITTTKIAAPDFGRAVPIAHNLYNWHRDVPSGNIDDAVSLYQPRAPRSLLMQSEEQERLLKITRSFTGAPTDHIAICRSPVECGDGQIMGRTEGAIKSLYHRTLLSLRDDLVKGGVNLEQVGD
jgi:RNA polymerase sigma-70 factor (ECF subfamily)